jgi:hypothetical protein
MFKHVLVFLVFVIVLASSYANEKKLYKVVDEKGKSSFSQFPPKKNNENVEDVYVKTINNALAVRKVGDKEYCGSISLPSYMYYRSKKPNYHLEKLDRSITNWKSRLESTEQSIERDSQNQFKRSNSKYNKYENSSQRNSRFAQWDKRNKKNIEKVKEFNCAIAWAEKKQNGETENGLPINTNREVERLKVLLGKHKEKMFNTCGTEPVFDPTSTHRKLKTKNWEKCTKPFKDDLKKISNRIKYMLRG